MKKLCLSLAIVHLASFAVAQTEHEWIVGNTFTNPGERIVAEIDAGTIDTYDGVGIVGEVIDYNGNWGYAIPIVSDFQMFLKFSGGHAFKIVQHAKTPNIILRLRKISDSKFHLIANCPNTHRGVRVRFKKVVGAPSVTMGDPAVLNATGELVITEPQYGSSFSGKVGINSNFPDAELTVNGIVHAEEVKVDLSVPGPDYVFEEDYPLLPLEETKSYIDQHKHLPGIPSSADMQQNGVNLLEMNMKLLEKVEELTLHLIEQNNRIDRQQKEIDGLKTRLNK